MMAGICEGIDAAFLQDKKGNKIKIPKISEANNQIFEDDCVQYSYNQLQKFIFEYKNTCITKWCVVFIQTDQQKIARKLKLFTKLKFKKQYR